MKAARATDSADTQPSRTTVKRSRIRITRPADLARDLWEPAEVDATERMLVQHHGNGAKPDRELVREILACFDSPASRDAWFELVRHELPPAPRPKKGAKDDFGFTADERPVVLFRRYVESARKWLKVHPHERVAVHYTGQVLVNQPYERELLERGLAVAVPYSAEELDMAGLVHSTVLGTTTFPRLEAAKDRLAILQRKRADLDEQIAAARSHRPGASIRDIAERLAKGQPVDSISQSAPQADELLRLRQATDDAIRLLEDEIRRLRAALSDETAASLRQEYSGIVQEVSAAVAKITAAKARVAHMRNEVALEGLDSTRIRDLDLNEAPLADWVSRHA